jgi:hypothetical protein
MCIYKMTTSILEQEYNEPDRPYSQTELQYNRDKVLHALRVGSTRAHHLKCDHFYCVKDNGRKEKEIKEANSGDVGNCSVCWKFNKTPRHLKARARVLINSFHMTCFEPSKYMSYEDVDIEIIFYKWLYEEFNQ